MHHSALSVSVITETENYRNSWVTARIFDGAPPFPLHIIVSFASRCMVERKRVHACTL
ncbi:MAG: hypothetical protein GY820_45020 [Gammaproteobacteria bacterium]|nr:hypothetical protein [Gammaproteobacteria bacterium]